MVLPKFVCIGAPRCGTRWLAQCLAEHPQIALPENEVYFFTTRRVVHSFWSRGVEWYASLFDGCIEPGVTNWGEITPTYLFDDDSPQLMHQCIPGAKLICCVRDQSERAYSWYRLFLKANPDIYFTRYSFRKFLTYHTEVYGREGFYLEHLQRYLVLYPRQSILVLLYDDLKNDPSAFIRDVYSFLDVDTAFEPPSLKRRINPMLLEVTRSRGLSRAAMRLKAHRGLFRIGSLLEGLATVQIDANDLPPRHQLDSETRINMADLYQEHNQRLGEFLGRDLCHWNQGHEHPVV